MCFQEKRVSMDHIDGVHRNTTFLSEVRVFPRENRVVVR